MINNATLIGRLGKDPELKQMPSGDSVCNFSMATSEKWTTKDGEKKESVEWHNIVVYKKLADICARYLFTGSLVYVSGKLKTRSWEKKDGSKGYSTEIVCDDMRMLGSKENGEKIETPTPKAPSDRYDDNSAYGGTTYNPKGKKAEYTENDIPF